MTPEIEALLAEHIGLEAESIGRKSIELAVRVRMNACGAGNPVAYLTRLADEPAELAALLEEIVVPETWFFRDAEPFRFAAKLAVGFALAHPHRDFRVLSAPCSTGEEPYSIAMAFLDSGMRPTQFHIDAVDLSPVLLDKARAGVYGASSFRADRDRLRERHFHALPSGSEWQLSADVRKLVSFHQTNLVSSELLRRQAPYQMVFCRNLLIYLTRPARAQVIEALHDRLAEGGVVVLGHAEALDRLDARFRPAATAAAFVYERVPKGNARATQPLFGLPAPAAPPTASAAGKRRSTPLPTPAVQATPPAPLAAALPPAVVVSPPANAPSSLARATELAGRGRLAEAAALCDAHLRDAGPDAATYYLLGTIRQASGDVAAAIASLERALYLDPTHYAALVHLALLLDQRGERSAAAQLRKRAERVAPGGGGSR